MKFLMCSRVCLNSTLHDSLINIICYFKSFNIHYLLSMLLYAKTSHPAGISVVEKISGNGVMFTASCWILITASSVFRLLCIRSTKDVFRGFGRLVDRNFVVLYVKIPFTPRSRSCPRNVHRTTTPTSNVEPPNRFSFITAQSPRSHANFDVRLSPSGIGSNNVERPLRPQGPQLPRNTRRSCRSKSMRRCPFLRLPDRRSKSLRKAV